MVWALRFIEPDSPQDLCYFSDIERFDYKVFRANGLLGQSVNFLISAEFLRERVEAAWRLDATGARM